MWKLPEPLPAPPNATMRHLWVCFEKKRRRWLLRFGWTGTVFPLADGELCPLRVVQSNGVPVWRGDLSIRLQRHQGTDWSHFDDSDELITVDAAWYTRTLAALPGRRNENRVDQSAT
jgi:hypothetical protein